MRRLLIILILLMLPVSGWGATYYVNTSTGANGNNGTAAETPFLDADYAVQLLTADDTLNIVAPATAPSRGKLISKAAGGDGTPITVQGYGDTPAYHTSSWDVSHGATIPALAVNGNCEAWLSASLMWRQENSSTSLGDAYARESTIKNSGSYSLNLTRSASTPYYYFQFYAPASTEFTLSFYHQEASESTYPRYYVDSATDVQGLQSDGTTWGTSYGFTSTTSVGSFRQQQRTFTTKSAGLYKIKFYMPFSDTTYLDDVTITPTTATFAWALNDEESDTYELSWYLPACASFGKCTSTAWSASGLEALEYVPQASSLENCVATDGSWWYESGILYYNMVSGETTGNMHLEAGVLYYTTGTNVDSIYIAHDYWVLNNVNQYLGNRHGIYVYNATAFIGSNGSSNFNYSCGWITDGTTSATLTDCAGRVTYGEDVFEFAGTSTVSCNRCYASEAFDDGFFVIGSATATMNFCVAVNNGYEADGNCAGLGVESATAKAYFYNCLNYGAERGIQIGSNAESAAINCISISKSSGDYGLYMLDATAESTCTHSNNIGNTKSANWTLGATEALTDPKFISAATGNFRLQATSPCINAGTVPFSDGDGDQYDYPGNMVWSDTTDGAIGAWSDGVEIGAYGWFGGILLTYNNWRYLDIWLY